MNFVKTKTGRLIEGSTPWGTFTVEVDQAASGQPLRLVTAAGIEVGKATVTMLEPATAKFTNEELDLAHTRAAICDQCPYKTSFTIQNGKFPVAAVRCRKCGCGNLSFLTGKCPLDQWNNEDHNV